MTPDGPRIGHDGIALRPQCGEAGPCDLPRVELFDHVEHGMRQRLVREHGGARAREQVAVRVQQESQVSNACSHVTSDRYGLQEFTAARRATTP
jgi:hypothetical protein